jgi:hypothetical protein
MRIRIGLVFAAVVTVVVVLAVLGVVRDDPRVETMARAQACAGRANCRAAKTRIMRTAFFQDHQFRVGAATVDVRCTRSLYLVGEYSCRVTR